MIENISKLIANIKANFRSIKLREYDQREERKHTN
jgi:hypothetical protein